MDVRIGVTHTPKELEVEMPEGTDVEKLRTSLDKALGAGGTLWLTDRKGRQVGVPVEKVAYLEIGKPDDGRRIGFGG